jgi:hypothetical protein
VSRSACTSALPPCCSSVVWPTPGVPRTSITHHSVAAVPQPAHGPLLFRPGPVPPGAARRPHAQHGSTPRLSGRESRTTASVELRFPGGDIRYPAPGSPAAGCRRTLPLLLDASRNGVSHLYELIWGIRSSACRLRIPRPVRRPSLGPRGESLRASGSGNDRLSDSLVSIPLAIPNVRLKGGAVYERRKP